MVYRRPCLKQAKVSDSLIISHCSTTIRGMTFGGRPMIFSRSKCVPLNGQTAPFYTSTSLAVFVAECERLGLTVKVGRSFECREMIAGRKVISEISSLPTIDLECLKLPTVLG